MTILETLDNDDITAFIKQLSEISFLDKYYVFDSPKGISIRVIYANGDFEVISCDYEKKSFCGYIGKYTSSGDVVDFIGSFTGFNDFESLISNFFETKLD